MCKRLSLGIGFFMKVLDAGNCNRYVVHAEYVMATGSFELTESRFTQRRSRISSVTTRREPHRSITEVLDRLAALTHKVTADGYAFDISSADLLDKIERDEDWHHGLRTIKKHKLHHRLIK